jgi:uncharacterized membrane protein HdeD (DUF308 family)
MVALFFGGNGIALVRQLLWRRSPTLFWLASTLIVVGVGYIVATGAAESIARSLWPVPFDAVKTKEFELRAPCVTPRLLGVMLIVGPALAVLAPVLMFKYKRIWLKILFGVCVSLLYFFLLYVSPIPEKLARLVFSEDTLKVPYHCSQTNQ